MHCAPTKEPMRANRLILTFHFLRWPAKSTEESRAKAREYLLYPIDMFQTHCSLFPESELHFEITHFCRRHGYPDVASVFPKGSLWDFLSCPPLISRRGVPKNNISSGQRGHFAQSKKATRSSWRTDLSGHNVSIRMSA